MAEYFVIRREKCERCDGFGNETVTNGDVTLDVALPCPECEMTGFVGTPVDLLEVLAKVRWTEIGDVITKDGYEKGAVDLRFNNLTIED